MNKYSVFYHHVKCAAQETGCSVGEMLDAVCSWGVEYLELDRDDLGADDAQVQALAQFMAAHGMKPASIYGFYDWGQSGPMPGEDDLLLHRAEILGCGRVMVIPGFYSNLCDQEKCDREKARMIEGMSRIVALAKSRGLTVTIECFDDERSPIATIEGMADFLEAVPELMVTLETGNFLFSGDDILQAQQRFCDRVRHVHLKDRYLPAAGEIPPGEPKQAVTGLMMYPCAVGHGHIPIHQVLEGLARQDYDGIMTIEHFGAASYAEAIRDSARWLKERERAL